MQNKTRRHTTLGLIVILVATLWVPAARAEILVAQSRTSEAIYGGATYTVDFNGAAAGGTTFTFDTAEPNTRVMFLFNAECAVDGARTRWVGIDILLDAAGPGGEVAVSPSNGDNALCSGDGTTSGDFSLDGWVSASTVATALIAQAGTHSVRVRVNGGNSGLARLDDMSFTVVR